MRLKSKYATLVALIMLTATPRALDQLTDLKNHAQERFRAELLNIFWSFTTPESRRESARQNAEFLARMQAAAPNCSEAAAAARTPAARAVSRFARSNSNALELELRQPATYEWSATENHTAAAQGNQAMEFIRTDGPPAQGSEVSALSGQWVGGQWQEDLPVAGDVKDRAPFAEAATLPRLDGAIAQFDVEQEALTEALPAAARPRPQPKREMAEAQRLAQRFVQTSFQIRLPENLERLLSDRGINSDTLIKVHDALAPAKTKCRVRVLRVAPEAPAEAPRPLEKPAIIS